jgi:hypothetical protein
MDDEQTQTQYAQALHRATKPGARLYMLEFGRHNINGVEFDGLPADNFERVLGACGWRVDYVGPSTYVGIFGPETEAFMTKMMTMSSQPGFPEQMKPEQDRMRALQDRLHVIEPLLENHRVHMPMWAVAATRLD